jgi:hypothetical protein
MKLQRIISNQTLRKIGELTVNGLWDLIGRLVDIFQPDECANYFSSCGYDPERSERWPDWSAQGSATDKWIVCPLLRGGPDDLGDVDETGRLSNRSG